MFIINAPVRPSGTAPARLARSDRPQSVPLCLINSMTDYRPENSGVRFTLPDGTKVWRLGIRSEGALSLNVMFSEYHLPKGARVFLYNNDQSEVLGSFNHLNNSERSILPVAPIQGDELIIEYQEPMEAAFPGKLAVGEVNHGYRKFRISEPQPDFAAFQCMPAVACYQDSTTRYDAIDRRVVLMIINGRLVVRERSSTTRQMTGNLTSLRLHIA